MSKQTYTIEQIMAAFDAVKRSVDAVGGDGAADVERFLIDDVATDVRNALTGGDAAAEPRTSTWILYYEGDPDTGNPADFYPVDWQIYNRTDVTIMPLGCDVRAAWEPGDVMAYYPFSNYHC